MEILTHEHLPPLAKSSESHVALQTYGFSGLIFKNAQGKDVARLNYDVRRFSENQEQSKAGSRNNWGSTNQFAYAASFGQAMVEPISKALARRSELMAASAVHFLDENAVDAK